ncbi:MAG: glycosyltransferase family 2 protein [Candidatus Bathyarchaeales archaeon]
MEYPLVSVIILNYNGLTNLKTILEKCLRSVLNTNYPNFEVLFVDNASTDGSVKFIKGKFGRDPRLRIIQNTRNWGFAEGNNIGIRNAKGEYVALLNSDTKVDPRWLTELVKIVQMPTIGAAQSKLLQMDSPDTLDCAGGFLDYYGYHLERGRGEDANKYNKVDEIFYAKGAGALIKKEVLNKTGLFDSETFLYFDETDLCWRIWLSGYKVVFVPSSIVYHAPSLTASKLQNAIRLYFYTRNHMLILLKNYNTQNMLKTLTASLLLELRNMIKFIMKREPFNSLAIFKALLWNMLHLKQTWKKRRITQKLVRKIPDEHIKKLMLKPFPPFPLSLIISKARYHKSNAN